MYIIEACLNSQITSAEVIEELKNKNIILADIDRQLRGMGTNLNQMAHVANGQGRIPTVKTLLQIADEVKSIKQEVDVEWQLTRQSTAKP
ncbi:plasmid mobilization relaxosome protein MobC [Oribacterium sp. WCC10]|uniref:plasmid mobilization relaxosome protein MobC n=1 Tax=Oribacterium sp. WCC10 TaxID=1855343 RepID=UPI0008E605B7|nr:mobilisation protein (MobC) [Oribacterium sp. WCC10]